MHTIPDLPLLSQSIQCTGGKVAQLTIERLFRDFAASIQGTCNTALEDSGYAGRISVPEFELEWWCGYIKDALRHSTEELSSNNTSVGSDPTDLK